MTVPTAVHASQVVSSSDKEECRAVPSTCFWTLDHLQQALNELCIRYGYPIIEHLDTFATEQSGSAESGELVACSYLAAAVACALRVSSANPPLAFGPWSETPVLAHLDAVIPPVRAVRDLFSEPPPPRLAAETDFSMHRPIFLVPEFADGELLAMLLADPLLVDPRLDLATDYCRVVRAGIRRPDLASGSPDCPDQGPEADLFECAVEVRLSRLLAAVRHGLALVERETGARIAPGEPWGAAWEPIAAPAPEWMAMLPELPVWARVTDAFGPTPAETLARWLALAPTAPSSSAMSALRTRVYLAHHLAVLAAGSPAIGWAALLSVADDRGATLLATNTAGVSVLSVSVQSAETDWVSEGRAETPSIRPPLRILTAIGPVADQIAHVYRLDGPFSSVGDLLCRVPATANPDLLRHLLDAGALDHLGDRARMETHWGEVVAWCSALALDHSTPEPTVTGESVFGTPVEQEVPLDDVRGWWERVTSVGAMTGMSDSPPAIRIGGSIDLGNVTIRGSRSWRAEGEDLNVIATEDGACGAHVVLVGRDSGAGAPLSISVRPVPSARDVTASLWIESALVAAPRPQVEVVVPLLGDRDRDLERLSRLQATLREHKGDSPVRLVLSRADSRKVLERSGVDGVTWSAALVDALELLLGPHCAALKDGA